MKNKFRKLLIRFVLGLPLLVGCARSSNQQNGGAPSVPIPTAVTSIEGSSVSNGGSEVELWHRFRALENPWTLNDHCDVYCDNSIQFEPRPAVDTEHLSEWLIRALQEQIIPFLQLTTSNEVLESEERIHLYEMVTKGRFKFEFISGSSGDRMADNRGRLCDSRVVFDRRNNNLLCELKESVWVHLFSDDGYLTTRGMALLIHEMMKFAYFSGLNISSDEQYETSSKLLEYAPGIFTQQLCSLPNPRSLDFRSPHPRGQIFPEDQLFLQSFEYTR